MALTMMGLPPSGPPVGPPVGMAIERANFGPKKHRNDPAVFGNKLHYIKQIFGDKLRNKFHRTHDYHDHSGYGHSSSGGHSKGQSAAISALTLLAFLFFLNILQNCLRDNFFTTTTTTTAAPGTAVGSRREIEIGQIKRPLNEEYEYEEYEDTTEKLAMEPRTTTALQIFHSDMTMRPMVRIEQGTHNINGKIKVFRRP